MPRPSGFIKRQIPRYFRILSSFAPALAARQAMRLFTTPRRFEIPPREKQFAEGARQFFTRDGIFATFWGESLKAPKGRVLLLHGWSGRGTQMGAFAKSLLARGYQALAVDGVAHGQSRGKQTNPREFQKMLFELDREFGPFQAVIAHSFGAGCSAWALHEGMRAKKLAFVSSISNFDDVVNGFAESISLSPKAADCLMGLVRSRIERQEPLDVAKMISELKQEVLIVHDEEDSAVSFDEVLRILALSPAREVLRTRGLGHQRILRDEKVVEAVAEFVDRPV